MPSTVYSPRRAPASTKQLSPTTAGPVITASGWTSAPSATYTPSDIWNPGMPTSTRPSRMSLWARTYAGSVPTSSQ